MKQLLLAAPCVLLFLAACAGTQSGTPGMEKAAAAASAGHYGVAVETYRKEAAGAPSDAAGEALFQMAYFLAFYDNPQKDYALALQGFERYVKLYPRGPRIKDAKNWRATLSAMLDLQRKIDDLKQIDIRHEEKRAP